jgi:hypothetical protein
MQLLSVVVRELLPRWQRANNGDPVVPAPDDDFIAVLVGSSDENVCIVIRLDANH